MTTVLRALNGHTREIKSKAHGTAVNMEILLQKDFQGVEFRCYDIFHSH